MMSQFCKTNTWFVKKLLTANKVLTSFNESSLLCLRLFLLDGICTIFSHQDEFQGYARLFARRMILNASQGGMSILDTDG